MSVAKLQVPTTLEQLKATERSYDTALQENLRLTDHNRELEQQVERLTRVFPPAQDDQVAYMTPPRPVMSVATQEIPMADQPVKIFLRGDETVEIDAVGPISHTTITPGEDPVRLREIIRSERIRKKIVQGERAVMKISLDQAQKANRKHKRRSLRLQAQAERHLEVIEALTPCFSRLLEVLAVATEGKDHVIQVGGADVAMLNKARVAIQELA